MTSPVLVIHGGAGSRILNDEQAARYKNSLLAILADVYPRLKRGASATTCAVRAVELLENDPLYNAGKGSKIQSDGHIRMSAALMDGARGHFSGCVNVEGVKNPIHLARALRAHKNRVLAGSGARTFAREIGLTFASPFTARARAQYKKRRIGKSGTVGAVVLDSKGHLAAATSTGGLGFEYPHRVSDSSTVAGNFANRHCAVSATGVGERIVDFAAASKICALVESGLALESCSRAMIAKALRERAEFGFIAIDRRGRIFADTSTELLLWASASRIGTRSF